LPRYRWSTRFLILVEFFFALGRGRFFWLHTARSCDPPPSLGLAPQRLRTVTHDSDFLRYFFSSCPGQFLSPLCQQLLWGEVRSKGSCFFAGGRHLRTGPDSRTEGFSHLLPSVYPFETSLRVASSTSESQLSPLRQDRGLVDAFQRPQQRSCDYSNQSELRVNLFFCHLLAPETPLLSRTSCTGFSSQRPVTFPNPSFAS